MQLVRHRVTANERMDDLVDTGLDRRRQIIVMTLCDGMFHGEHDMGGVGPLPSTM